MARAILDPSPEAPPAIEPPDRIQMIPTMMSNHQYHLRPNNFPVWLPESICIVAEDDFDFVRAMFNFFIVEDNKKKIHDRLQVGLITRKED
jgi:hypothetical protein